MFSGKLKVISLSCYHLPPTIVHLLSRFCKSVFFLLFSSHLSSHPLPCPLVFAGSLSESVSDRVDTDTSPQIAESG
ncbi:hypothetical protein J1N35_002953 [Gossypium stocksii]|uniref:Uncharacterized protein n=1 Tax=Gossypium stocksii TaxID=47602 RepID=A0A9D3WM46_9ROSI|nr:hypothetical protein J1N35_002953 [Gossypium stocksii]